MQTLIARAAAAFPEKMHALFDRIHAHNQHGPVPHVKTLQEPMGFLYTCAYCNSGMSFLSLLPMCRLKGQSSDQISKFPFDTDDYLCLLSSQLTS